MLNLSESYLTFWDWYEKLIREPGSEKLSTGGWFSAATKLFDRYGLIDEGGFIPDEANADRSASQAAAEAAINESMKNGPLKKDRSAKTVRAELAKAWRLTPQVIDALNQVFGDGAPRTLSAASVPAGFPLRLASALQVTDKRPGQTAKAGTLKDVMSRWQEVSVPSSASARRAYFRRVQKALHDGQPVIIVWDVSWGLRWQRGRSAGRLRPCPLALSAGSACGEAGPARPCTRGKGATGGLWPPEAPLHPPCPRRSGREGAERGGTSKGSRVDWEEAKR